jgi:phage baseplate assembly protein W
MFFDNSFGEQIGVKKSYSDLDFNFKVNPNYGDIMPIKDNACIKNSIKNLIMTNIYGRPFNSLVGVGIEDYIFEKLDTITMSTIIVEIKRVVLKYEPRVSDLKVAIRPDGNTVHILVIFLVVVTNETETVSLTLTRVR